MIKTGVVIIGAGPTGLSLACQLVRHDIDFVIVDKNEGVTPYSKAIGVQARTLEIYEQLGLAHEAVEEGAIAGKARLLAGGEVRGEFDFSNIGEGLSPYPYVLMLEQSKNERLLYNYLQGREKEVLWNRELESFSQTERGVTAQVKTADGASQIIEAQYLVGCDGAKSPVRHALGLGFEGSTFERMFFVADAQVDWRLSHDALHVCLAKQSFVVFFPLKGGQRYRIVGVFPEEFAREEGDILYEEIEQRIKDEALLELDVHDVEWFSTYKVHTRHVSKFSTGRCFLAGDAAHVHSPAGAQGMNTGIQDSYNLAWKMALVLKGHSGEKLLDTYNQERLENAKNLLQTTDRMFQLVASPEWFLAFLRMNLFPYIAKYIFNLDTVKQFIFPIVSQIGINYRHSTLSRHAGVDGFKVKAGDRMPYFLVDGESVYDKLHQAKFHWLVFSSLPGDVSALERELENEYTELVDIQVIPLNPHVAEAFGTNEPFSVLLRPDNYIGLISEDTSLKRLRDYLTSLIDYR
jgi:2-polyprenyl-6-methoxyphenol hydroxylase-like FAD-dependent oxidoreductase